MNLRLISAHIVNDVVNGQSLTPVLEHYLAPLKPKDSAFVQALCYGLIRHYYQVDFIRQQLVSKPLKKKDKDINALLLIGLYQLAFMRTKVHAAVSETVAAAKHKPWAKALINGVLRQYLRQQKELDQLIEQTPVAFYAHPEWLIHQLQQDWGKASESLLQMNNQQAAMVLRVNCSKVSRSDYLQQLIAQNIEAEAVNVCDTAIVLKQAVNVVDLPGFNEGLVSVQDTAAQLTAELLDVREGMRVLDLCAAPGGKTAAVLERYPKIHMTAVDIDEQRLQRVTENCQRLQLKAEIVAGDAGLAEQWLPHAHFDRIIVDAPCSAVGVIRRHPDIKLLRKETDIIALQQTQAKILNAAWHLLAPGGVLLYATCSVLKQENELQVQQFLRQHEDASELVISAGWGMAQLHGRQILTGEQGMDGFFYAKLQKAHG